MVLVDTSVWVHHLRAGNSALEALLLDAEVVCHPFVIGELACGNIANWKEILALLHALPAVPVITQGEFLHFLESHSLMGTGIGFVDVHLLGSARLARVPLWTKDRRLQEAATELKLAFL